MKKICQYCKTEFIAARASNRYCSRACYRMAKRKLHFERDEELAQKLGLSLDDLKRRRRAGRLAIEPSRDTRMRKPKTYAQIRAANRARKVEAGWRGQAVLGGGGGEHSSRYDPDYNRRYYQRRKDKQAKLKV